MPEYLGNYVSSMTGPGREATIWQKGWLFSIVLEEDGKEVYTAVARSKKDASQIEWDWVHHHHNDEKIQKNPGWLRLTYGVLPTYEQFKQHFEENVEGGQYRVGVKGKDAMYIKRGAYDARDLYDIVKSLTAQWDVNGNEHAGDVASSILETLQIEWI